MRWNRNNDFENLELKQKRIGKTNLLTEKRRRKSGRKTVKGESVEMKRHIYVNRKVSQIWLSELGSCNNQINEKWKESEKHGFDFEWYDMIWWWYCICIVRGSIAIYSTLISWLVSQVQNIFHMTWHLLTFSPSYFEFHYFMTNVYSMKFLECHSNSKNI